MPQIHGLTGLVSRQPSAVQGIQLTDATNRNLTTYNRNNEINIADQHSRADRLGDHPNDSQSGIDMEDEIEDDEVIVLEADN